MRDVETLLRRQAVGRRQERVESLGGEMRDRFDGQLIVNHAFDAPLSEGAPKLIIKPNFKSRILR
jgi:hypothetical protein